MRSSLKIILFFSVFSILSGFRAHPALSATYETRSEKETDSGKFQAINPVHLVEDHSQALPLWVKAGIRNATVLHIDTHHDLLPVPSTSQLSRLSALVNSGQLTALEAAGRFSTPRREALYGINNYLNVAFRLGIIKEIFWAYPYQGSPTPEKLSAYRDYLVEMAVPAWKADFRALKIDPPFLKGTIGGIPVTVGSLTDFSNGSAPLLLDIDLDFFPPLYRNPVATPYLQLIGGFARFIKERQLRPTHTVIAYSHNGGHMPIELRYLGSWLKTMLTQPEILDMETPLAWLVKSEAVHREYFKQFESAAELYEGLIKDFPNDPDSYFSLAMNLIAQEKKDLAVKSLEKARKLDPVYLLGYGTIAEFYNQRKEPELALKILEGAERLTPAEPFLWNILANLHHNLGNYRKAEKYYRKLLKLEPDSPAFLAYLGDSLFFLDNYKEALTCYQQAIAISRKWQDSYLYPWVWLQTAQTQAKLGRDVEAVTTLEQFLRDYPDLPTETISEAKQLLTRLKNDHTVKDR